MARKRSCFPGCLLVVVLLAGAAGGYFLWDRQAAGFEYILVFDDAAGVSRGTPVMLAEEQVGSVAEVRRSADGREEVVVRIAHRHAPAIHESGNTSARIERSGLLFRRASVVLVNRGERGAGIAEGSRVEGLGGAVDEALWRGGAALSGAARQAQALTSEQIARLEAWAATDGRQMQDDVQAFIRSLDASAREGSEAALARGRQLLDQMQSDEARARAGAAADDARAILGGWLDSAGRAVESGRERIDTLRGGQTAPAPTPAPTPDPDEAASPG